MTDLLFHLPLSTQTFNQYQLVSLVADTSLQEGNDTWLYIWGTNLFTSKSTYLQLIGTKDKFIWLLSGYRALTVNKKENYFSGNC